MARRFVVQTSLALVFAGAPMWAGAQALVTERGLSLNAALEVATASLERCRADGYKVTITVLNRHARTSVVLSEDGVNPHTVENSLRKAYTAFTTRHPHGRDGQARAARAVRLHAARQDHSA